MNEFIMLNWYHYDLNYKIIRNLKNNIINNKIICKKNNNIKRIKTEFRLKIKKD